RAPTAPRRWELGLVASRVPDPLVERAPAPAVELGEGTVTVSPPQELGGRCDERPGQRGLPPQVSAPHLVEAAAGRTDRLRRRDADVRPVCERGQWIGELETEAVAGCP